MRVLVAGGGICGLATAIALRHHGIDALVLEQAPLLNEIGAGIQIAANAAIVFRALGLEAPLRGGVGLRCALWGSSRSPTTTATCAAARCSTRRRSAMRRPAATVRRCTTSI